MTLDAFIDLLTTSAADGVTAQLSPFDAANMLVQIRCLQALAAPPVDVPDVEPVDGEA